MCQAEKDFAEIRGVAKTYILTMLKNATGYLTSESNGAVANAIELIYAFFVARRGRV